MTPFFSIIIPLYNAETFIESAVKQLVHQTYTGCELIFSVDGSPDKSFEIASLIASKYKNIRVIHQENQGPGVARNNALKIANGEYILFLDVDDLYSTSLLSTIKSYIDDYTPDVLAYSYIEHNNIGNYDFSCVYKPHIAVNNHEIRRLFNDYFVRLPFNNGFAWNRAYRKSFLIENNIFFGKQRIQEDELFNIKVYQAASSMVTIPEILYTYVIHSSNSIFRFNPSLFWDYCDVDKGLSDLYVYWTLDSVYALKYKYIRHYNAIINSIRNLILNLDKDANYSIDDIINHCSTLRTIAAIQANSWTDSCKYFKILKAQRLTELAVRLKFAHKINITKKWLKMHFTQPRIFTYCKL